MMFVAESEKACLRPGCLIIDVSCDEGMGFYFAKPTTFRKPILKVEQADYYAVDHTPSYLWESASRAISAALVVHLPSVLERPGMLATERDHQEGSEHRRRRRGETRHPGISEPEAGVSARPDVIVCADRFLDSCTRSVSTSTDSCHLPSHVNRNCRPPFRVVGRQQ